jgi:hypothetical protein
MIIGAFILTGCGSNPVDPDPKPTGGNLILPAGQAWTYNEAGATVGYIFRGDSTCLNIAKIADVWTVTGEFPYSVSGVSLTMQGTAMDFSVSSNGNTLTLHAPGGAAGQTLTRTAGVNIKDDPTPTGNLVLPEGQAWTNIHEFPGDADGFIFREDSTVAVIGSLESGGWVMYYEGTYSVSGTTLIIVDPEYGGFTDYDFTISADGNSLVLSFMEETIMTLKRTTGVIIDDIPPPPPPTGGNLVLPEGQAWTNIHDDPNDAVGFIFRADSTLAAIYNTGFGVWVIILEATYSVNGTKLITVDPEDDEFTDWDFTISADGNTLILDGVWELKVTTGVHPIEIPMFKAPERITKNNVFGTNGTRGVFKRIGAKK